MKDEDFRRHLEEDAARVQGGADDMSRAFDGLSSARMPFLRAHLAFAVLDGYLMLAADIYGRKGTIVKLERDRNVITASRGSQVASCTHYLDQAAIGFKYTGIQTDPSLVPIVENGFPSMVEVWKPSGAGPLFGADRSDMQAKISAIMTFLKAAG